MLLCIGCLPTLNAQISARAERPNARYEAGETAVFRVTGPPQTTVDYRLFRDDYLPDLQAGSVQLNAAGEATISYPTAQPGSVFCELTAGGAMHLSGLQVSPFEVEQVGTEPADFDAYWQQQKDYLATFPINPVVTFVETHEYANSYLVQLNGPANRPIYGYLTVPFGEGPFPATVSFPSFGNDPSLVNPEPALAERANQIHFNLTIFPTPPEEVDPNDYQDNDITDRDSIFYRDILLVGVRAVDYLLSRDDVIPDKISSMGVSQGGGLGMLVAGLDPRMTTLAISNPTHGRLYAYNIGGASAFPFYLGIAEQVVDIPNYFEDVEAAIGYYDNINFAKRFAGPSLFTTGYIDRVCPSSTVFAMFNQLPGPKIMVHDLDGPHNSPDEYWQGRHAFLRRHQPEAIDPLFPFEPDLLGYHIDAGDDRTADMNEGPLPITATYERDGQSFTPGAVKWIQRNGPGTATFANEQAVSTTVSFSQPGVYRLELMIEDDSLANELTYTTIHDNFYVTAFQPDNIPPTVLLSSPVDSTTTTFQVTATVSEPVDQVLPSDFAIGNGTLSNFSQQGTTISFTVNPIQPGSVLVSCPQGRFADLSGNENEASNLLQVIYYTIDFPPIFEPEFMLTSLVSGRSMDLMWNTNADHLTKEYRVYKSENGTDYEEIHRVDALREREVEFYQLQDSALVVGANHYYATQFFLNGEEQRSDTIQQEFSIDLTEAVLFPNPGMEKFSLNLTKFNGQTATISFVDEAGRQLEPLGERVIPEGVFELRLARNYPSGMYFFFIRFENGRTFGLPVVLR